MSSSTLTVRICWSIVLGALVGAVLVGAGYFFELAHPLVTTSVTTTAAPASTARVSLCDESICALLESLGGSGACPRHLGASRACIERSLAPTCVVGECRLDDDDVPVCAVVDSRPLSFECACACDR